MGRRGGNSDQKITQSEKIREGNRRRNKRWKENNREYVMELDRRKSRRSYHKNHEENKARQRAAKKKIWDAMSQRERRDFKLRQTYKISLDEFEARLKAQGDKCACCGTDSPGGRGWQMDHCHKQKHFRGVLCVKCNTGLGLANDDPEILQRWIDYLRR